MVRTKSPNRLEHILSSGVSTLLELGYRGTRLDEVARRAEVSVGTLYLYVGSKEALFELALRRVLGDDLPAETVLPFRGTSGAGITDWVWKRFKKISRFPVLNAAVSAPKPADPLAELESILGEVWEWLSSHWEAIELIERCARDWPELHMLYYKQFRRGVFEKATKYMTRRMDQGALRRYDDPATAMRVVAESLAFFAMHRHIRPDSANLDEATCRDTVIKMLIAGFDPSCSDRAK
jgi:AcrR family transcriptional regulator